MSQKMMKNIWIKHKLLILTIGYLAVSGVFVYFSVISEIRVIKSRADDIQKKIIDNQIAKSRLEKIPEMEIAYDNFQSKKDALEVIIDPNGKVDFIKKMEFLAESTENKVVIKVIEEDNKITDAKIKAMEAAKKKGIEPSIKEKLTHTNYFFLELGLNGSYKNLVNFIHKLENTYNYVNVVSLEVKKEKETDDAKKTSIQKPQISDVFSVRDVTGLDAEGSEKKDKEFISSVLKVVVYTK